LLAPLWITLRRTELAPASLLNQAATLDEVLLTGGDTELTRKPFPREVAAAIAALLVHLALRQPLVLVIDDAHRGGASSDHRLWGNLWGAVTFGGAGQFSKAILRSRSKFARPYMSRFRYLILQFLPSRAPLL